MPQSLGFLEFPANSYYDAFRMFSLVIAALVFGLALWLRLREPVSFRQPGDRDRNVAIMLFQVFLVFFNLRGLGRPFSIYILPVAVIANVYILRGIKKRAQGHD